MSDTSASPSVAAEAESILAERISVQFFRMGDKERTLELDRGTTLQDLMIEKELKSPPWEMMYEGVKTTDFDRVLEPGCQVVASKMTRGGR